MCSLSKRLIPAFGICLLASVQMANADQNRVYIEQSDDSNSLFIDQTDAVGSTVGGLTIQTSSVSAVDLNTLNNLEIDSLGFAPADVAVQSGGGNEADVIISGSNGTVRLYQSNPNFDPGTNSASVNLDGNGLAAIGQVGFGNTALLTVSDSGSSGTILQSGNENKANLGVSRGNTGLISQVGNNNTTTLDVDGVETSVSYFVQGNNLTAINPQQGVQVLSNASSVTITQTSIVGGGG
jgi:hypothetical protein